MAGGYMPLSASREASDSAHSVVQAGRHEQSVAGTRSSGYPKRVLDVISSCLLLVLFGPVMLLIAVVIRLDTPGRALCVQRRVGQGGRVFRFYKFRSMFCDVDHTVAHRSYCKQYINGGSGAPEKDGHDGHYKPPANGSSITPVGYWLRKYSLDEWPQLINVLRGDMSLVGPRPSMDYEVEEYADWHRQRLAVLPGITGLAQINGRSTLAFDDIVRFDVHYIQQRSLWQDLVILLKTVPAVLLAHGAS